MNEVSFKDKLDKFFQNKITEFEIYYILREKDGSEYDYSSFFCKMPELKDILQNDYKEKAYEIVKGKEFEEFNIIGSQADSIEILDSNEIKNMKKIKKVLNKVYAENVGNTNISVSDIWGYSIVFKNDQNKKLSLFRKFTMPKTFNERRKLSIVNGSIKEIKEEIFTLDMNIDAIEIEGKTYIISKYYFEKLFSFDEEYIKCVESSLEHLKKENVINNFDEFSTRCLESGNLVRKLVHVVTNDRLKWLKNNISEAKNVANEYNLKVNFEDDKISYSKKDCNISDVMKLICGSCVKDAVDMHKYFASAVREVN